MKALRPKMGDKAAQQELMKAIKDPKVREQILGLIDTAEAGGDGGGAAAPAAPAAETPAPSEPPPA
jgi:hypothetical protein